MTKDERYPALQLFIDGHWIDAGSRHLDDVLNPATGEVLSQVPHATDDDINAAAEAAGRTFKSWKALPAYERAKILRKAADLMRERCEQIAVAMVLEQGKPLAEARMEVMAAADIFDWTAEEGRRIYGRVVPSRFPGVQWTVTREAVGPVAAFTPWNVPVVIPARKISAALAVGCTMVIKPSEETPASVLAIARALDDAGLPKGVLNVVYGVPAQVSEQLIFHPQIRKITFTGSTVVGKQLAAMAAQAGVKRTTMELGGHAPVLVFDDADLDQAVQSMVAFKYRNAGQVCIAPTRFYVHESIHDRFVDSFAEAARAIRIGDGLDPETRMGPLANPRRVAAMDAFVADALDQGATLKAGGQRGHNRGFFFEPTVLANVPATARAMNEEPFGPLAITAPFSTFDEALEQANRLPYGLAAYAFTRSTKTASMLGEALETGMLGLNNSFISMPETPFGGVKQSGYGSEGGTEGMDAYLTTKFISQM
ncbi:MULTISPECIES: NAD-dependent succinate-semialdehyde dehydrogenase [unclassified Aminobacter]|uniref:NAD-dependent succinate-semialdehyde dehydrogenase n=1 Tax=unclassified Aminobacter TaxID=2644704 RepID=UPI0004665927|nr:MULTISPECIES: NAD-dependent succinate-semialdehyde dehydrogenase [unclassified Aminobacter]TWH25983.1 succinate-semialdehyde dehydrogenase/glutarate-semialdehyde dehydrogenase [Aminobacter sp. J15]